MTTLISVLPSDPTTVVLELARQVVQRARTYELSKNAACVVGVSKQVPFVGDFKPEELMWWYRSD